MRLVPCPPPARRVPAVIGLLTLLALLAGCGSAPPSTFITLGECRAMHPPHPASPLPGCIDTERGIMPLEETYIAGVVQCEMAGLTDADAALEALAITARTYLGRYLERTDPDREVPIGPRFQCWKPPLHPRAVGAAIHTRGTVLHVDGALIDANYVSGARKLSIDCKPLSPREQGYADYASWDTMRAEYLRRRRARVRARFGGVSWTEVVVTRNEGRRGEAVQGTPMAPKRATNRGAFAQYAAVCLAENLGYETADILRYFYGDDIGFSRPLKPVMIEGGEIE